MQHGQPERPVQLVECLELLANAGALTRALVNDVKEAILSRVTAEGLWR